MIGVDPVSFPSLYDYCVMAALKSPGVIPPDGVKGWSRSHDWDIKKGQGTAGATVTDQGEPPAEGSITFQLWRNNSEEVNDFDDWEAFRELLKTAKTSKKKVTALDVVHPMLTDLEVFAVVVKKIGQLESKGGGLFTVTVDLLEYRPPKPSGGTPGGSKPASSAAASGGTGFIGPPPPPTAQSEAEKMITDLTAEAAAL